MTVLKWSAFLLLAAVLPAVAGEQGDAEEQYRLGYAYYDLHAVDRDYRKAMRWFAGAAKQGHAPAMVMLGKCHASRGCLCGRSAWTRSVCGASPHPGPAWPG